MSIKEGKRDKVLMFCLRLKEKEINRQDFKETNKYLVAIMVLLLYDNSEQVAHM